MTNSGDTLAWFNILERINKLMITGYLISIILLAVNYQLPKAVFWILFSGSGITLLLKIIQIVKSKVSLEKTLILWISLGGVLIVISWLLFDELMIYKFHAILGIQVIYFGLDSRSA